MLLPRKVDRSLLFLNFRAWTGMMKLDVGR
jgi:hypothetical protein